MEITRILIALMAKQPAQNVVVLIQELKTGNQHINVTLVLNSENRV